MKANTTPTNEANPAEATAPQATANERYTAALANAAAALSDPTINLVLPTREQVRAEIDKAAEVLGCNKKKAVSGYELLLMLVLAARNLGCIPNAPNAALRAICAHFDSNSSAMTKRLYESEGGKQSKADQFSNV